MKKNAGNAAGSRGMGSLTERVKRKVLSGGLTDREEALALAREPLEPLCRAADEIRRRFCGNSFDLCTIVNGKSGKCSEDCKYCAQSAFYDTETETWPLMGTGPLLAQAVENEEKGVLRYSVVTSGKRLSDEEVDQACRSLETLRRETKLGLCVSFGLLPEEAFVRLREAGADRVHNNLEASAGFFPRICTTHTQEEKKEAVRAARRAGLDVCSGGIIGLGETMEDRIDLALELRDLGVRSVPVNLLNPIAGTPCADRPVLTPEEMRRTVAVFRFLIPEAAIRLAGGRGLLPDKGKACFLSGANAAITGDMLTTAGISVETDLNMLRELGYEPGRLK